MAEGCLLGRPISELGEGRNDRTFRGRRDFLEAGPGRGGGGGSRRRSREAGSPAAELPSSGARGGGGCCSGEGSAASPAERTHNPTCALAPHGGKDPKLQNCLYLWWAAQRDRKSVV